MKCCKNFTLDRSRKVTRTVLRSYYCVTVFWDGTVGNNEISFSGRPTPRTIKCSARVSFRVKTETVFPIVIPSSIFNVHSRFLIAHHWGSAGPIIFLFFFCGIFPTTHFFWASRLPSPTKFPNILCTPTRFSIT